MEVCLNQKISLVLRIYSDNQCKIMREKQKYFSADRKMETKNSVENSLLKYLMFWVHIIFLHKFTWEGSFLSWIESIKLDH
jgi:hypothetical protein